MAAQTRETGAPAYARRGDEVQARYEGFVDRLRSYYTRLLRVVEREAPDLARRLADPPAPTAYGYQIVPALRPGRAPQPAARPQPVSYSWARTQGIVDQYAARLATVERDLDSIERQVGPARLALLERLVADYESLERDRRTADEHVKHNWFWQREAAEHPERFTRPTALVHVVVERERLLAALARDTQPSEERSVMAARAEGLMVVIQDAQPRPGLPAYAQVIERSAGSHVVRVPLYTDVPDRAFLDAAERAIEDVWRVDRFAVDVEIRPLAPATLYPGESPPAPGAHLDVAAHVARFPGDGAVLTTGPSRTHAIVGRYVALGPGEILGNTLAHEFGHILGFADRYLRGARDLGAGGYEILEIVTDPDDIMAAPGTGNVLPAHVEQLLGALR